MTLRLVCLASGRGSNFKALLDAIERGACDARMEALISDKPSAPALDIARERGIPVHVVDMAAVARGLPPDAGAEARRLAFDERLLAALEPHSPDLVVLAGYMRLLRSPRLFERYGGRILNIHPSLLPKYPGAHAQADAFAAGETVSGLTIHLVDETLDGGPILYQEPVDISSCRSAVEVSERILAREHIAYPRVIDRIAKGEIALSRPR